VSTPELTGNISVTMNIAPEDNLSLYMNIDIAVHRGEDGFHVIYTDPSGRTPDTEPPDVSFNSAEVALLAGFAQLYTEQLQTLTDAIDHRTRVR
jgi:hypothetical protein